MHYLYNIFYFRRIRHWRALANFSLIIVGIGYLLFTTYYLPWLFFPQIAGLRFILSLSLLGFTSLLSHQNLKGIRPNNQTPNHVDSCLSHKWVFFCGFFLFFLFFRVRKKVEFWFILTHQKKQKEWIYISNILF